MSMYKAIIVDDEYWARVSLQDKLKEIPEIEVIGEADSITKAKKEIEKLNPDILFLDVQLNDGTGFDLLNQLEFSGKVIFITAYDKYAVRAFEINALDYLMKPISERRLKMAIEKINITKAPIKKKIPEKFKYDDRLMVIYRDYIHFIKISAIVLITAAQDYTLIKATDGKEYLLSKSMNEWESRLPEKKFCRIHRSSIINFEFIEKITKYSSNSANIYLKDFDEPFKVSRSYYKKLKERYN